MDDRRATPSLGIAVPNLNHGRYLAEALESLTAERGRPVHVALMDGGSTDESGAVTERYRPRLDWVRSGPDAGQAAAVNEGIAMLTRHHPEIGYVGFLNADDLVVGSGLEVLARALDANPGWVAAAGRGQLIDADGTAMGEYPVGPFTREAMAHRCTICQPATLVRRSAWEAAGGLDPSFHMSFDYDLWWRLARIGTIGFVDAVVAASRDHEATKTRTGRQRYFEESIRIVRREHGGVPWHWCISEALERQGGWNLPPRLSAGGKLLAGARASAAFVARNVFGRNR